VDQTIHKFAVTLFAITFTTATATFIFTCHFYLPSLARLGRSLGNGPIDTVDQAQIN
jgi:hypothetical protein